MNLRPRRAEPPRVDITPLIDVVFLMLIFFMVSTTFDKQTQLKIDLPEAAATADQPEDEQQLSVTIDSQGNFYVNERELVKHNGLTLQRTMEKIVDGRDDIPVVVSGDRRAPLQSMMTVLDVTSRMGLSRLSFVALQTPLEEAE